VSSNQLDLLGQYISQVLIPRLNYADGLFKEGRYYEALVSLKSVIRALVRRTDDDEETLRAWLKRVDDVGEQVRRVRGDTRAGTVWRRRRTGNLLARDLYQDLDFEVWGRLHELGYFSLPRRWAGLRSGETLSTLDKKPDSKPIPERLSEEVA